MTELDIIETKIRTSFSGVKGIICQTNGDEGDSLQRTGTYYLLSYYLQDDDKYREQLVRDLSLLEVPHGYWARSADIMKWYGDYRYTSRDQLSIAMAACAGLGCTKELGAMAGLLGRNRGFHTNIYRNGIAPSEQTPKTPDIISPEQLAAIIRGNQLWALYPFLIFLDISLLFMVVYGRTLNLWDADNMLLSHLVLAHMKMSTPISWLARKIYGTKAVSILRSLYKYQSAELNGIPPFFDLQKLALRKLITS
jgi:hypothetical protein